MGHLDADLDPEGTAIVSTGLKTIAQQLWCSEHPDETGEPARHLAGVGETVYT